MSCLVCEHKTDYGDEKLYCTRYPQILEIINDSYVCGEFICDYHEMHRKLRRSMCEMQRTIDELKRNHRLQIERLRTKNRKLKLKNQRLGVRENEQDED